MHIDAGTVIQARIVRAVGSALARAAAIMNVCVGALVVAVAAAGGACCRRTGQRHILETRERRAGLRSYRTGLFRNVYSGKC